MLDVHTKSEGTGLDGTKYEMTGEHRPSNGIDRDFNVFDDSKVKTLQAGQTFVANAPPQRHSFRLWSTGRTVGQALPWPTFLPEESIFPVRC